MTTRIMVVDDEPSIGRLLMYQLASFGYQVSYFRDGLEALERLPATRPDLVILDVMMPLISGWEVCRQIRTYSAVPVIMLTAKGADMDIVTGLGAGADDYVTKPFNMAQLHARIEAVLRRAAPATRQRALVGLAPRPDPHLNDPTEAARHPSIFPQSPRPEDTRSPHAPRSDGTAANVELSQPRPEAPAGAMPAKPPFHLGQHLRHTRLARALTLHQVERACGIRWEFLQAIEQENWSYVPRTQLGHALHAYADYLGIDLLPLMGRPRPTRPARPLIPLQFAAALALVMVLVLVVGMYLF